MDTNSRVLNSKRQKLDGREEFSNSLSNLPDEIIEKIISMLEMKDAVRTSILSKRWEYLWTSIPHLYFYHSNDAARSPLVNIVDRALVLRGPADIEKFDLRFPVLGDACRVKLWISAAVRRNVKELHIFLNNINFNEPFSLPHSLFTSAKLMDLNLNMAWLVKFPSTVCFSSLKKLCLNSVVFSDEYSTQQLFSNCPVLEELFLEGCSWENLKFVSICAPKLLGLIIIEGVSELSSASDGCQITIVGASLEYFYLRGEFLNEYIFCNSSVHDYAEIEFSCDSVERFRLLAYRLHKVLRGLSSAKYLSLSPFDAFKVVLNSASEVLAQIPLFNDAAALMLEVAPVDIGSKELLTMLQYFPHLQTLIFDEGIKLSLDNVEDDGVLEPLPPCFLSHLKVFKLNQFRGDPNELDALKVLLKNARVLEKMILVCCADFNGGREMKKRVAKQLSRLPKGSESCQVVLEF